ncbi:MAG TPA: hypothetical protein DDX39_02845 [Bacteroidales bacterium]|nr:MAG: hypothetical protein A2W98_03040 [Bacteroidetes bacterium GWF2_33_38]OFY90311.1 MAG: hypothetical protein A2236_04575 [Bacteroidetes bacterium RIFOXYA2_FULL_33_7]HBF87555.1 hypothetical protein [Bacteroidales bacterium]
MSNNYQNIHQTLIDKCKSGDKKAQFEIYKLYYKSMYNTSLRIVNSTQEAEDIMQEAFLSAFDKIEYYSGNVSFGAWLKKIVVNKSIDTLRNNKIFSSFDEINTDECVEYETYEFSNQIEINQQVEKIKKAINSLPNGYRIIISLNLIEGYDHEEISQILNITSATSRSQFMRAKRKLIQLLN